MNTHYNARLTAWGRATLVRRVVIDGEPVPRVAAALIVSRQTVYKWLRRFAADGWAGLVDRPSRPARSPRATPPRLVQRIVRLREQRLTGPEIAERLGLPSSTVGRVLQRLGMGRLRQPANVRGPAYQRAVPGELLHVGTKALPRFLAVGHRIHGNRSKAGRRQGLGHDHLHVAVDDATCIAFAELHPTAQAPACAAFLAHAQHWFATLGIRVRAVMTDNAKAYPPALRTLPGVRHLRTRPYHPQTNGKAERFIQTALRRWVYKRPYRTSTRRNAVLPAFLDAYNFERPHRAIGRVPPVFGYLMQCQQRVRTAGAVFVRDSGPALACTRWTVWCSGDTSRAAVGPTRHRLGCACIGGSNGNGRDLCPEPALRFTIVAGAHLIIGYPRRT